MNLAQINPFYLLQEKESEIEALKKEIEVLKTQLESEVDASELDNTDNG